MNASTRGGTNPAISIDTTSETSVPNSKYKSRMNSDLSNNFDSITKNNKNNANGKFA